ncbi:hypothetical protein QL285_077185 [Trifolium repens]|nr:hypothetical protein QL285_077185 [Trifolium repens]
MEDDTNDSEDSHYIPSDIEAEEAYIEKVVEPKRLRGSTRMQDVWDMDADDIIIVNLDKKGRPTGQEGSNLTRFIGSVVRRKEYASIGYISWKDMPDNDKSEMLKLIESKYEFVPPINDTTREMLKSEINESRVDLNQYRKLVHHWFSEKGQEKLNKYDNETGTSQSVDEIQSDMPWKDDIYSKVKGTEKRELRDKVKQMEKKQNSTDAVLANVLSLIQNRFVGEDVNEILRAARQVTNASNAPDQTDSPSSCTDED